MKIHSIPTELFKLDGGAMFGVVPKIIWQKNYPTDENNLCVWAMRCLLVEDDNRLILIDTGAGNKQDEKFFSYYYLHGDDTLQKSINKAGYSLTDITDVFLTHLHFDHVGGAVQKVNNTYVLTFPNATYWSNKSQWEEATIHPNPREKASFLKENLLPIQESGKLQFIQEKQNIHFTKNIQIQFAFGHTNALMIPIIHHPTQTIAYVADLFPSIGHLPIAYVAGYDSNPLTSMQEKQTFLNEALKNNWILFFEHEPYVECCLLHQTEKGIRAKEQFDLSQKISNL